MHWHFVVSTEKWWAESPNYKSRSCSFLRPASSTFLIGHPRHLLVVDFNIGGGMPNVSMFYKWAWLMDDNGNDANVFFLHPGTSRSCSSLLLLLDDAEEPWRTRAMIEWWQTYWQTTSTAALLYMLEQGFVLFIHLNVDSLEVEPNTPLGREI